MDSRFTTFLTNHEKIISEIEQQTLPDAAVRSFADRLSEHHISLIALAADSDDPLRAYHALARPYLVQLTTYDPAVEVAINEAGRTYTPRKILRRCLDHLIDHLNHVEQGVAWQDKGTIPTPADGWIGSAETLPDDLLPLSVRELDAWLWRIDIMIDTMHSRLATLNTQQQTWMPPDGGWPIRTIVYHVGWGHLYYATALAHVLPQPTRERYRQASHALAERLTPILEKTDLETKVFVDDQFLTWEEFLQRLVKEQNALLELAR